MESSYSNRTLEPSPMPMALLGGNDHRTVFHRYMKEKIHNKSKMNQTNPLSKE